MSDSTTAAMRPDAEGHLVPSSNSHHDTPFARACAERRAAIFQVVSRDDIRDVSRQYLHAGRCAVLASRLLLDIVGNAVPPCDPDWLDENDREFPPGQIRDGSMVADLRVCLLAEAAIVVLQQLLSFVCQEFLADTLDPHSDPSTLSQHPMSLDEHLAQTRVALRETALAARAVIHRATDRKRVETVEMNASECHPGFSVNSHDQPLQRKVPRG